MGVDAVAGGVLLKHDDGDGVDECGGGASCFEDTPPDDGRDSHRLWWGWRNYEPRHRMVNCSARMFPRGQLGDLLVILAWLRCLVVRLLRY